MIQTRIGQQRGHADYTVQRRTDFMAHGGQKRSLGSGSVQRGFAGRDQLVGALRHTVFKMLVGVLQRLGFALQGRTTLLERQAAAMQSARQHLYFSHPRMALQRRHFSAAELSGSHSQMAKPPGKTISQTDSQHSGQRHR